MMTNNLLFLRDPNSSVYILVLFQRSTGASAISEIFSGQTQRTLSEVLEEESPILTISNLKKYTISDLKEHNFLVPENAEVFLVDMEDVQASQAGLEIKTRHATISALDILSRNNDEDISATNTLLLRKEDLKPKEREPRVRKLDLASSQALKEFGDALEEVVSSPDIPDAEKPEFINKTTSHAVEIFQARKKGVQFEESIQQKAQTLQKKGEIFSHKPKQEKAVQPPDLSKIPLWQDRKQGEKAKALDYLETHYGQYLTAFSAEQNNVFQDQIRAHDPKLVQGVINQLRGEGKGRKLRDFVKTRSARVDQELENVSVEDLKKKPRLASTLYSRETRAAKAKAAAPSRSVTRK
jgi:hypothetical protein